MLKKLVFQLKLTSVKLINFFMGPFGVKSELKVDLDGLEDVNVDFSEAIKTFKSSNLSYAESYEILKKDFEKKQPFNMVGWERFFRKQWDEI